MCSPTGPSGAHPRLGTDGDRLDDLADGGNVGQPAELTGEQQVPGADEGASMWFVNRIGLRSGGLGGQHGGMPDLLWDDVRNFFDPDLMGALPDVSVVLRPSCSSVTCGFGCPEGTSDLSLVADVGNEHLGDRPIGQIDDFVHLPR